MASFDRDVHFDPVPWDGDLRITMGEFWGDGGDFGHGSHTDHFAGVLVDEAFVHESGASFVPATLLWGCGGHVMGLGEAFYPSRCGDAHGSRRKFVFVHRWDLIV